ncbi:hypothetical protein ACFWYW_46600 [Nonomuraea sp. NPDC059023]|uniref:hypothetical protein n=1 Tax=unclassified Nonomuraea TaxID=2593643 RepID=UPI0036B55562
MSGNPLQSIYPPEGRPHMIKAFVHKDGDGDALEVEAFPDRACLRTSASAVVVSKADAPGVATAILLAAGWGQEPTFAVDADPPGADRWFDTGLGELELKGDLVTQTFSCGCGENEVLGVDGETAIQIGALFLRLGRAAKQAPPREAVERLMEVLEEMRNDPKTSEALAEPVDDRALAAALLSRFDLMEKQG